MLTCGSRTAPAPIGGQEVRTQPDGGGIRRRARGDGRGRHGGSGFGRVHQGEGYPAVVIWSLTSVAQCRGDAKNPGDDLFSRKAALSVSSALESLTSVFGMGTGVASPLESPGSSASGSFRQRLDARSRDRAGAGSSSMIDSRWVLILIIQPLTPGQLLKRSSPRPLVPLSFIRHRTSTCGLSNRWSPCGLTRLTRWGTSSRGELRT